MKSNHEATMSLKALAYKVLAGNQEGNCKATTLENLATFEATLDRKLPKKVANSVTRFDLNKPCHACSHYSIGPDPFGKGLMHWCGPFKETNNDMCWWNIAELAACPEGTVQNSIMSVGRHKRGKKNEHEPTS